MTVDLSSASGRHLDFQVFYVVVHPDAMANTPFSLEHSARYSMPLQPCLLVRSHGDLSPSALKFATKTIGSAAFHMAMNIP